MGCDSEWTDERQRRYDEVMWRLKNNFVTSGIPEFGTGAWTCMQCFCLVEANYCRQHREVCK